MNEFERCLKERRIVIIEASREMIEKELEGAKYDLSSAEESLHDEDYKWASVQAYYSMFHAAKALVFEKGYREKSHYCLLIALTYEEESARIAIENARNFLEKALALLKNDV